MKQEIDRIIDGCLNDYIFDGEIIREEYVNQIINLFPKWRVPSVDGWPENNPNVLYREKDYPELVFSGYGLNDSINTDTGFAIEPDRIKCWVPITEFLKIMEVNK